MAGSFLFDANRCTGCGACAVACTTENGLPYGAAWRRVETFNPRRHPLAPVFHLSLACNHCASAACMTACPARAYHRDAATAAVLLEPSRCIGCGYCSWACPYDAPVFDDSTGLMTKCTWCVDRQRAGLKPSCATHCPTGALDFTFDQAALKSATGTAGMAALKGWAPGTGALEPRLHVIPLKDGRMQPEMADGTGLLADVESVPPPPTGTRDISLRTEWPLTVFTLGAAVLVGAVAAAAAGAVRIDARLFALAAALVLGTAGAHLGQKARGWRAVLNVRDSWLSREVALISLFAALATAWLAIAPASTGPGWFAALAGFAALYSADRVYGVLPAGPGYRHSASVLFTGALVAGFAARRFWLAVPILAIKDVLYLTQVWRAADRRLRAAAAVARVLSGFAVPILVALSPRADYRLAIAGILLGEAIDRCEYYMDLERRTPRREMDRSLRERLAALIARPSSPAAGMPLSASSSSPRPS